MASNTSDSAPCAITSDFCGMADRSRVERFAPRKASAGSECEPIQAGATPKTIPVTNDSTNVNVQNGQRRAGIDGNKTRAAKCNQQDRSRAPVSQRQSGSTAHAG